MSANCLENQINRRSRTVCYLVLVGVVVPEKQECSALASSSWTHNEGYVPTELGGTPFCRLLYVISSPPREKIVPAISRRVVCRFPRISNAFPPRPFKFYSLMSAKPLSLFDPTLCDITRQSHRRLLCVDGEEGDEIRCRRECPKRHRWDACL